MYTQLQTWVVLLSTRNTVELRKQLNFRHPLLRQELVNFHHCFFICIQISNILGLPIYLKLTNFIFKIPSLFFFAAAMALVSTLSEMSSRGISWWVVAAGA
jgi:hypothetical protein